MDTFEMLAELSKNHNKEFIANKDGNKIVCGVDENNRLRCIFCDSLYMTSLDINHQWEELDKSR